MLQRKRPLRKAATMIEVAIIIPLMILLIAIAVDVVSGVYRYHQVATLSRMGARYASVHAGQYEEETGNPVVTETALKANVVLPHSVGLKPELLTVALSWLPDGNAYPWVISSNTGTSRDNMVRVVVTYQWHPIFFFGASLNLSSTSEVAISY